jgi:CO/xanthine dehydrogenase FAD-binding subunit
VIAFEFVFERPETAEAAYALWTKAGDEGKKPLYFSGGTEIVTAMRKGSVKADVVIDLKGIKAYTSHGVGLSPLNNDTFWLGGGLSLNTIEAAMPGSLLQAVASGIADHTVRNTLTLGGNICGRLPYREMVLALLTLSADAVLFTAEGYVRQPMHEVFHKRLQLGAGELLLGFELAPSAVNTVDAPDSQATHFFRRRRQKHTEIDYPICHVVVTRRGDTYKAAVGGVSAYVWYGEKTAATIQADQSPEEQAMVIWQRLEELAADDLRASKAYKLGLLKHDLIEAFTELGKINEAGETR